MARAATRNLSKLSAHDGDEGGKKSQGTGKQGNKWIEEQKAEHRNIRHGVREEK